MAELNTESLTPIRHIHLDKVGPNLKHIGALLRNMPNLESLHIRRLAPGQENAIQGQGHVHPIPDPIYTMLSLLQETANTLTSLSLHLSVNPSKIFRIRNSGEQPINSMELFKNLQHLSITSSVMMRGWELYVSPDDVRSLSATSTNS